ncbi:MAG: reverse transcriptase N-terminal domain-containing protein [bacterium]
MTAQKAGALIDGSEKWNSIKWKEAQREVRRLQMRIAKAVKRITVGRSHKGCL